MDQSRRDANQSVDRKPSFFIRILFRQNASWQGEIQWMEGQKTRRFRSALEMMALIHEAVEISEGPDSVNRLRSWSDEESVRKNSRPESKLVPG